MWFRYFLTPACNGPVKGEQQCLLVLKRLINTVPLLDVPIEVQLQ